MKNSLGNIVLRTLVSGVALAAVAGGAMAQITGPSSSQSPFVLPVAAGVQTVSIFTVGDNVGGYQMLGIPDGLGAYNNGDGTFTLLMNHEIPGGVGTIVRAHGQTGSFVSEWNINANPGNLLVNNGQDLATTVNVVNGTTMLSRLCSADLPAVSAFFNPNSGLGTQNRIYMNGEEVGAEGRAFGFVATGTSAGTAFELPHLGKFSWENSGRQPVRSGQDHRHRHR